MPLLSTFFKLEMVFEPPGSIYKKIWLEGQIFILFTVNKKSLLEYSSMGIITNLVLVTGIEKVVVNGQEKEKLVVSISEEEMKPIIVRE